MPTDPQAVVRAALQAAELFRLGQAPRGSELLVELVDALTPCLEADPQLANGLAPVVNAIVEAQLAGDFLALADLLESELVPAFD